MVAQPVVHHAAWALPVSGPPVPDGEVVVVDGRIAEVRRQSLSPDIQHGNAVLMPAFVNAHSHLEYTIFRNLNERLPFVDWLLETTRLKGLATEEEFAAAALVGAVENARAGVGLIGEWSDAPVSGKAIRKAGIRAVVYQELIALGASAPERFVEAQRKADAQRVEGGDAVVVHMAPHAPYTVCEPLLREFARGPCSIHCAESPAELEMLEWGTGEMVEAFRQFNLEPVTPGLRSVEYLRQVGILRPGMQLVHCVQVDGGDIEMIAASGASVAHCPKSNAKLGVGIAPIDEMLEAGIPVGLGTDSLMSNNRVDMFEEMRTASFLNAALGKPAISPSTLLRMATLDGAATLGRSEETGSLEVGKRADFAIVSLDGVHCAPVHDLEAALVFSAAASDVVATFIGGAITETPQEFADSLRTCRELEAGFRSQI